MVSLHWLFLIKGAVNLSVHFLQLCIIIFLIAGSLFSLIKYIGNWSEILVGEGCYQVDYIVMFIFVDPPIVNELTRQDIKIGSNLSVICNVTQGNPNFWNISWTKLGDMKFIQNKPTLQLSEIQKKDSGTYICAVLVIYSSKDKETYNQSMVVNVQCKCFISKENKWFFIKQAVYKFNFFSLTVLVSLITNNVH